MQVRTELRVWLVGEGWGRWSWNSRDAEGERMETQRRNRRRRAWCAVVIVRDGLRQEEGRWVETGAEGWVAGLCLAGLVVVGGVGRVAGASLGAGAAERRNRNWR